MVDRIPAPVSAVEMEIAPSREGAEVTIVDIARALGIKVESARMLAWRQRWPYRRVSFRGPREGRGGLNWRNVYRVADLLARVQRALSAPAARGKAGADDALQRYFCEPGPGWTPPDSAESARKRAAPGPGRPRALRHPVAAEEAARVLGVGRMTSRSESAIGPRHPGGATAPLGDIQAPLCQPQHARALPPGLDQAGFAQPIGHRRHATGFDVLPQFDQSGLQQAGVEPRARRARQQLQHAQAAMLLDDHEECLPPAGLELELLLFVGLRLDDFRFFEFPIGVSHLLFSFCPRRDAGRPLQRPPRTPVSRRGRL